MIIGLSGYSRTGKDTVGDYLVREHGFARVAFADALRELLEEIDPVVEGRSLREHVLEVGWDHYKLWGDGVRLLINTGRGLRKIFGDDILLTAVQHKIDRLLDNEQDDRPEGIVITDVRHRNEAEWLADFGGRLVRITRPGAVPQGMDRLLDDWPFDHVISNEEGIPELHRKVDRALEHLCRSFFPSPQGSSIPAPPLKSTGRTLSSSTVSAKRSSR